MTYYDYITTRITLENVWRRLDKKRSCKIAAFEVMKEITTLDLNYKFYLQNGAMLSGGEF